MASGTERFEKSIVLIRILVGWVFLSEGIQKFLYPSALGVGRFERIGIPAPGVMAPLVGGMEIVFGVLVLVGLLTRWSALPLLGVIVGALVTTKVPFLLKHGFWAVLHEARTDVSMLLGLIFLMIVGGGSLAVDARLHYRKRSLGGQPAND